MITTDEDRELFGNIQHPLMIKTLCKTGREGNILNPTNAIEEKSAANTLLDFFLKKQYYRTFNSNLEDIKYIKGGGAWMA